MHTSQDKTVMRGQILTYICIAEAHMDIQKLIFFKTDLVLAHFKMSQNQ